MSILKYPHLFEPIRLGGQVYKNRIFGAPTGVKDNLQTGQPPLFDGLAYFERKAKGGVATVTMGEGQVDKEHGLACDSRNCGKTSIAEIMDNLFAYQYSILQPDRRGAFLAKVIEMNAAPREAYMD